MKVTFDIPYELARPVARIIEDMRGYDGSDGDQADRAFMDELGIDVDEFAQATAIAMSLPEKIREAARLKGA